MEKILNTPTEKQVLEVLESAFATYGKLEYHDAICIGKKYGYKGSSRNVIEILESVTQKQIDDLGIRMKKRLKRYINKCISDPSLMSYNKLLWVITKHILKTDAIKIHEPKHEEIQKKRKAWKTLQMHADEAHAQYLKEKGDYYKEK